MFGPQLHEHHLTLFTDSYVVRGMLTAPGARVTDVLNHAENGLLVLDDATFEEFGSHVGTDRAPFAQVNLAAVLFAVSDDVVASMPEMRMAKVPQQALISVPPFRVVGRIHLPAVESLREALVELRQPFVPVSQATYWSEGLREPRTQTSFLAFNHARAQILAPYEEQDPWADARMAALRGQEEGAIGLPGGGIAPGGFGPGGLVEGGLDVGGSAPSGPGASPAAEVPQVPWPEADQIRGDRT